MFDLNILNVKGTYIFHSAKFYNELYN